MYESESTSGGVAVFQTLRQVVKKKWSIVADRISQTNLKYILQIFQNIWHFLSQQNYKYFENNVNKYFIKKWSVVALNEISRTRLKHILQLFETRLEYFKDLIPIKFKATSYWL